MPTAPMVLQQLRHGNGLSLALSLRLHECQSDKHTPTPHEFNCRLMPGFFGLFTQALLGVLSFSTLILKWYYEEPRRKLAVFGFDSSKQLIGAIFMHVLNIIVASIISGFKTRGDPCEWYAVNVLVDCTLGVLVSYYLLLLSQQVFRYQSGNYTGGEHQDDTDFCFKEVNWRAYWEQVGIWLLIQCGMKVITMIFLLIFARPLIWIAGTLLWPFSSFPKTTLMVVMVILPLVTNSFQFWMTDAFLMFHERIKTPLLSKHTSRQDAARAQRRQQEQREGREGRDCGRVC
mmetsp:Transcript_45492/g.112964  ORF Transcript_45492/g.112964 Transcript_45492/m.112964 type:complete len:288 (+) Transcript_45492:245-1108(+)